MRTSSPKIKGGTKSLDLTEGFKHFLDIQRRRNDFMQETDMRVKRGLWTTAIKLRIGAAAVCPSTCCCWFYITYMNDWLLAMKLHLFSLKP
jgi:hypothetical protein